MELKEILIHGLEFRYKLLARMKSDCDYYLGYGGRKSKYLWARNEARQISTMREIYDSFPDREKPEWITLEEIDAYAEKMGA